MALGTPMVLYTLQSCASAHRFVLLCRPGASLLPIPDKNIYYSNRKKKGRNKNKIWLFVCGESCALTRLLWQDRELGSISLTAEKLCQAAQSSGEGTRKLVPVRMFGSKLPLCSRAKVTLKWQQELRPLELQQGFCLFSG